MPFVQPSRSDVHVNRPLTNISVAYLQSQDKFVAGRVFPNVSVSKQSDRYFEYERGEFNRDEMQIRALSSESAGGTYTIDNTPTYYCDVWAWHKDIDDQVRANADDPLDLDQDATEICTRKDLIRREVAWAATYFTTGVWGGTDQTGVDAGPGANQFLQWDDANSTPIEDLRAQMTDMGEDTGFRPNKLTLGRQVYDKLVDHPDIVGRLDRGQTSGPAIANKDSLAAILELDEVLVMDAIQNTAPKGSDASHAFIGGKAALLTYSPPRPGILVPSAGYHFGWTGYLGATQEGRRILRMRADLIKSDRVEIESAWDQKLIAADLGRFFTTAVA